jgi:hypothetical protein
MEWRPISTLSRLARLGRAPSGRAVPRFGTRGSVRRLIRKLVAGAASLLTPPAGGGVMVPVLIPVRSSPRRRR